MSCIDNVFQKKNRALITYITVGYPSIEATKKIVPLLVASGSDIVELGIPYSDPLVDGATIQQASLCALRKGVTPRHCLELAKQMRQEVDVPLVFMTYFNPVYKYGIKKFCYESAISGVNGLIVPDLPPDEGSELEVIANSEGLDLIYLLAPTSNEERIEIVARKSRGFIYLVSITGTTGARKNLITDLDELVARIRKKTTKPLCVGFGISTPKQASEVVRVADGVIIGSQIIQLMQAKDDYTSVCRFVRELSQAIYRPSDS